jgi:hypothetical protein
VCNGVIETAATKSDQETTKIELFAATNEATDDVEALGLKERTYCSGDMLVVAYEDNFHIGEVLTIADDEGKETYSVKFMSRSGRKWKWSESPEVLPVHENFVIQPRPTLTPINSRLNYNIDNMALVEASYTQYKLQHF